MFTYFIEGWRGWNVQRCKLKVYLLHDFHKCSRDAGQWCSYCPKFAYNAVPAMEMLFVYCIVHTAETKGPNVLPCHIIINFYDAFLAGKSRRPFFFQTFYFAIALPRCIIRHYFQSVRPHSHHSMYLWAAPDGCLNILARNFSWPCGSWPQSRLCPPRKPPSLSAPASLEPVFLKKKLKKNRKQPQTLWFVSSRTIAQGQSLTFTKALHFHSTASQVIVLLMYIVLDSVLVTHRRNLM